MPSLRLARVLALALTQTHFCATLRLDPALRGEHLRHDAQALSDALHKQEDPFWHPWTKDDDGGEKKRHVESTGPSASGLAPLGHSDSIHDIEANDTHVTSKIVSVNSSTMANDTHVTSRVIRSNSSTVASENTSRIIAKKKVVRSNASADNKSHVVSRIISSESSARDTNNNSRVFRRVSHAKSGDKIKIISSESSVRDADNNSRVIARVSHAKSAGESETEATKLRSNASRAKVASNRSSGKTEQKEEGTNTAKNDARSSKGWLGKTKEWISDHRGSDDSKERSDDAHGSNVSTKEEEHRDSILSNASERLQRDASNASERLQKDASRSNSSKAGLNDTHGSNSSKGNRSEEKAKVIVPIGKSGLTALPQPQLLCALRHAIGLSGTVFGAPQARMWQRWPKCAVVSSGGTLSLHDHGKDIDAADLVMRFNSAPTEDLEHLVGARDDMRIVNNQFVPRSMGRPTATMEICTRPSYGCYAAGDVYKHLDCDGDGVKDHVCTTTASSMLWLVISGEGCPLEWGEPRLSAKDCPGDPRNRKIVNNTWAEDKPINDTKVTNGTSYVVVPMGPVPLAEHFHEVHPASDLYVLDTSVQDGLGDFLTLAYNNTAIDPTEQRWEKNNTWKAHVVPTSGGVGMILAMSICDEVLAYGMATTPAAKEAPYYYWDQKGDASWHGTFQAEKDLWRRIAVNSAQDIDDTEVAVIPGFANLHCGPEEPPSPIFWRPAEELEKLAKVR